MLFREVSEASSRPGHSSLPAVRLDLRIFVHEEDDTRLGNRLKREAARGRDITEILDKCAPRDRARATGEVSRGVCGWCVEHW